MEGAPEIGGNRSGNRREIGAFSGGRKSRKTQQDARKSLRDLAAEGPNRACAEIGKSLGGLYRLGVLAG